MYLVVAMAWLEKSNEMFWKARHVWYIAKLADPFANCGHERVKHYSQKERQIWCNTNDSLSTFSLINRTLLATSCFYFLFMLINSYLSSSDPFTSFQGSDDCMYWFPSLDMAKTFRRASRNFTSSINVINSVKSLFTAEISSESWELRKTSGCVLLKLLLRNVRAREAKFPKFASSSVLTYHFCIVNLNMISAIIIIKH